MRSTNAGIIHLHPVETLPAIGAFEEALFHMTP